MKKLQFTIEINASKEKLWEALWQDQNYRKWTSIFSEGSHAVSDWNEGSEILFLDPNGDGMFAIIEKVIPFEKMHFLHKSEIKNGERLTESFGPEAIEQYDVEVKDDHLLLTVTLNAPEEYIPYFNEIFPKALTLVKDIAEK